MSVSVRRILSLVLAAAVFIAAFFVMPRQEASAASTIKYSLSYSGDRVILTLKPQSSTNIIYYTANGKNPTKKSAVYIKPLSAGKQVTIKAVECTKSGTKTATLKLVMKPRAQKPTFSISTSGGTKYLTIKTATSGAKIYYTLDGSKPTSKSKVYSGKIKYTDGTVVRALAYKSGMKVSKTARYYVSKDAEPEDSGSYAEQVCELVAKERKAVGKSALVLDDALCRAAELRAKELAALFDHTRPDGRGCETVLRDLGIGWSAAGENIAYGMGMLYTADEVMDGWMHSPGHKANILSPYFGKIGVGRYKVGSTVYWVQVFTN